ncbi:MAG: RDD family protein [Rickettsiales bacterium]|jgi:uncharacterized RDD family membrane protein YckC|nr:RDD family protein [Rickettsiales bacterium]
MRRIFFSIKKDDIYATPFKRVFSFLFDILFVYILLIIIINCLSYFNFDLNPFVETAVIENNITQIQKNMDYSNLLKIQYTYLAMILLYQTFFICSKKQATIGQQLLKVMVVHKKKSKMGVFDAVFRGIYAYLNIQIYFIGCLTYFFKEDGALLHDILSDSIVINLKK